MGPTDGHRHRPGRLPPDRGDRRLTAPTPLVAVLADDLIWGTRLAALVRAAGGEPLTVRSVPTLVSTLAGGPARAIVDLTARAYDGIDAVAAAVTAGAAVLAVGQHDDLDLRRRALAAGADRVVPYRSLAVPSGTAVVRRWIASPLRVATR